jgi:hypothetical protein
MTQFLECDNYVILFGNYVKMPENKALTFVSEIELIFIIMKQF